MRKFAVFLFLSLSACGKFESHKTPYTVVGVDEAFIPYIQRYLSEKGRPLDYYIPMGFTDLPNNTVGLCTRWDEGYRQILIDKPYWDTASEAERISLIAHELGHCDLNRGHSNDWKSIMYEFNIGSNNFDELFHPVGVDHKAIHDHETISE